MTRRAESRALWVGVLAASFLACGAVVVLLMGAPPRRVSSRDAGTPAAAPRAMAVAPTGAFATGGVPSSGGAAVRDLFAVALPRYVIAVDALAAAHHAGADLGDTRLVVDSARRNLLSEHARAAVGAPALTALERVLDAAEAAATASDKSADRRADALTDAMLALNAALAAANLGYGIDTDVRDDDTGRRFVLLFSFAVERVRLYRSGSQVVRTRQLRRIDELGWHYNLLGFTTGERPDALVMLDQVEARLTDRVLPQLAAAPTHFYALETDAMRTTWHGRLERQIARVIGRAYGDADPSPTRMRELGTQLAARRRLLERLGAGVSFTPPRGLAMSAQLVNNLAMLAAPADAATLRAIETKLATAPMRDAYARGRSLLVSSIERHEAQHRLDHLATVPLPMPAPLLRIVGALRDESGKPRVLAMRARGELSAYTAEIARDDRTSGVALSIVTQFAVDSDFWGTAECYAALVLLEHVARAAGVPIATPLTRDSAVDRAAVTETYVALTELPPAALQKAAADTWHTLFGRPLVPLVLVR